MAGMTAELFPDGTRRLTLSKDQFTRVSAVLKGVYQRTKCTGILLADMSGLVIAHNGILHPSTVSMITAVAAGNYAATNELARLIGETNGFTMCFHEGKNNSIYLTGLDESFLLGIVFGTNQTFGMIRVLAQKAGEQLLPILHLPPEQGSQQVELVKREVDDDAFREELSSKLASLLVRK